MEFFSFLHYSLFVSALLLSKLVIMLVCCSQRGGRTMHESIFRSNKSAFVSVLHFQNVCGIIKQSDQDLRLRELCEEGRVHPKRWRTNCCNKIDSQRRPNAYYLANQHHLRLDECFEAYPPLWSSESEAQIRSKVAPGTAELHFRSTPKRAARHRRRG